MVRERIFKIRGCLFTRISYTQICNFFNKSAKMTPCFIKKRQIVILYLIFSCRKDIFRALVRKLIFRES
mgnify:CR=1 FL=1